MRHLRRLGHCLIAGAFAGAILTPLQFLLWPDLHAGGGRVLLAVVAFASWAALWFGLVLFVLVEVASLPMPYLAGQRGFSVGLWRWLAVVVAGVAAAVGWYNRQQTRDLLSPEYRHALAVAASLISLYAMVTLAQAIRRRRRRHARAAALAGAGVLLAGVWTVWILASPRAPTAAAAEPRRYAVSHRLLFVSWEGADLPWLLPAIDGGDMPFLRSRRDAGAWGQLHALRPHVRRVALASLATGCAPGVNGVLGQSAYRIPWLAEQPVELLLAGPWPTPQQLPWRAWEHAPAPAPRRAPLWEILERAGVSVGVAGWPAWGEASWAVAPPQPRTIRPAAVLDPDRQAAIGPALLAQPALADTAREAFAMTAETVALAREDARREPVGALLVDLDLPLRLRPSWTSEDPRSAAEEVLRQASRMLDAELQALWELEGGERTLLVVVSPYGMAPPSQWQRLLHLGASPERWRVSPAGSPDGFVLFCGPGVRGGTRLRGGRVADVTATVLYLLELPVARDMAGRVLLDAVSDDFANATPLRLVPSYPTAGADRTYRR
jgi:hypothetical protein